MAVRSVSVISEMWLKLTLLCVFGCTSSVSKLFPLMPFGGFIKLDMILLLYFFNKYFASHFRSVNLKTECVFSLLHLLFNLIQLIKVEMNTMFKAFSNSQLNSCTVNKYLAHAKNIKLLQF